MKKKVVKKTPSLPNHNYSSDDVIQIRRTIYGMNMASPSPEVSSSLYSKNQQQYQNAEYERGWSSPKTPYSVISRDANNTQYNSFADRYGLSNSMKPDSSPVIIDTRSKMIDVSMNNNSYNNNNNNYNSSYNQHKKQPTTLETLASMNPRFSSANSSPFSAETLSHLNHHDDHQQQYQQDYQSSGNIDHEKQSQSFNSLQPDQSAGIDQLADWISAVKNVKHTTPNVDYSMLSRENPFPSSSLSSALKPFIENDNKVNTTLIDKHASPKRTASIIKELINPVDIPEAIPDLTYESLHLNDNDNDNDYIILKDTTESLNVETDLNEIALESEAATETNFINSYCYYYDDDKKLKKMPHYVTHRIQLAHQEFERYLAKGRTQTITSLQKTLKQGADAHVDILKKTLEKRELNLITDKTLKNLDESLVQLISKKLLIYTDKVFNTTNDNNNNDNDIRKEDNNESDEFITYLNNRIEGLLVEIKNNSLKELETEMLALASSKLETIQIQIDDRRDYWFKQIEKDVAAVHEMKRTSTQKKLDGHWKNRMKKFLGATTEEPYNNNDMDVEKESDILLARERRKIKKILGYMDHLLSKIDRASISINAEDAIIKSKSFSVNDKNNNSDDDDDKPHVRVSKKIEKRDEALRMLRQMASIVELSLNKQESLAKSILTETMELKHQLLK